MEGYRMSQRSPSRCSAHPKECQCGADRHANRSDRVSERLVLSPGDILPYKGKLTYDYMASSFRVIT